jgi:predicted nucleic acid-binding protein
VYLDSAYLAKFYVNETDSAAVRQAIAEAAERVSSMWALAEMTCIFHRHVREGVLSATQAQILREQFLEHVEQGVWALVPVTEVILRKCSKAVGDLPAGVYVRAGDAVHLTTARELNEPSIWTNDRHLLAAAPYFGLTGRSADRI